MSHIRAFPNRFIGECMIGIRFLPAIAIALLAGCSSNVTLQNADGTASKVRLETTFAVHGKPAPTVLIGHGSGGVAYSHRLWASTIRDWGYNVVVIDHYSQRGIGIHTGKVVAGATSYDRIKDFAYTINWVKSQKWHEGNIVIVGYSQGGAGILAFANTSTMEREGLLSETIDSVSAVAGFYPACFFFSPPAKPRVPVLMLLAEKDDLARPEYCGHLDEKFYSVKILKNATHSFDENIPAHVRLSFTHRYSAEAVEESKIYLREFLDLHLKSSTVNSVK